MIPFELGEIWEQVFDEHGRYVRMAASGRRYTLDLERISLAHVRGRTRSGKSSMLLEPLAYEIARTKAPLFYLNLAPEPGSFHHVKRAAEMAGKTFKYFVLEPKADSWCFPPFQALAGDDTWPIFPGQFFTHAFDAMSGDNPYFVWQGVAAVLEAAKEFAVSSGSVDPSACEVADFMNRDDQRRRFEHADGIRMPIQFIAEIPTLGHGDREILIEECLDHNDVVYVYLSNLSNKVVSKLIAGLFFFSIVHFAKQRTNEGRAGNGVFMIVDEFQSILGHSLESVLTESAKYGGGMHYILANQSTSQLRRQDVDLSHLMFENSQLKVYFSSFDDDARTIQSVSKLSRVERQRSTTAGQTLLGMSEGMSERVVPFISENAILDASSTLGMTVVIHDDGSGHREPAFVQMRHRTPNLTKSALPLAPPRAAPPPDLGPGFRIPLDNAARQQRHELVDTFIEKCLVERFWKSS